MKKCAVLYVVFCIALQNTTRYIAVALCLFLSGVTFAAGVPPIPTLPPLPPSGASSSVAPAMAGVAIPASVGDPLPVVPLKPLPRVKGGAFDLRYVSVGQLVDLLYGDAMHVPHVIDSDVLQDARLVSFQYDGKAGDLRSFVKVFLDSQGFKVETRDGVDFVSKKPASEAKAPDRETFVYRPRYRTAEYLAKAVQPLFSGHMTASAGAPVSFPVGEAGRAPVAASGVSAAAPARVPIAPSSRASVTSADELVFSGEASEIRDLKKVLAELDRVPGEVVVRGWVYEVSNINSRNSAFSIAASLFGGIPGWGGKLSLSNGSTDADPTALRFSSSMLDVAISALDADSRFKQVSDPHVRVVSGERVRLNVGSQVPTLGSISYQGSSGTPVQSVEYQDAGLIFDVQPVVMGDVVQVRLSEQMSSFVATTTGVNNSPTKNTREMSTVVNMKDGEVIVLGGLVQDQDTFSRNSVGWLPSFLDGKSGSKGRTEVLLVLQVSKVADL
ncbi:bacterial type II and III secretion system family protein [Burkholderia thailandensis 34]|uniref:type II secretion system protein GspD n=1 Tax=Burkholderia thailandensis TaxID=57975 RepID=UPI0005D83419|nr:type II secretory pathway protein [Burkholderia thailandensis]AJY29527.1 bacterial type II and III secretion system family protein [Burkholderia thailandensis 34]AOJ55870.1 type II secretory pathway protein [Burkholderia thailandensis]KXF60124.1 type II secretory pathway protein [Burkholderia thailandensis]